MEENRQKYLARIKQLQDELFALGVQREIFDKNMPLADLEELGKALADQLKTRKKFIGKVVK